MTSRTSTRPGPSTRQTLCWISCAAALAASAATVLSGRSEGAMWLALAIALGALEVWRSRPRARVEQTIIGAYTLEEKVGEGGMGIVYKASHALLQRPLAIKFLAASRAGEQAVQRFEREARVTSRLTHPNTISIYDFGRTEEGAFYYAMEYVDGLDLQTLVERHGPQAPARVAHLLAQLAGALAEAHGAGLIHRDVKPANVMVCERGGMLDVVKVLDFGLVQETEESGGDGDRVVGTPLYLSPEALTSPENLDARSDLYALGAVGYFLLTGSAPFSGTDVVDVCRQHLHCQPVPVSMRAHATVPRELERLVMSCLAKSRDERPRSAAELQAALLPLGAEWTQPRARRWWADSGRTTALHGVEPSTPTVALAA